ncbi:MAG: polysaccharide deacetylase family protein [bacterium]|nr:polysaccharide deacetylase family protein [bacterium]
MEHFIKNQVFRICNLIPNISSGASILMYHSIGYNRATFTVSLEMFEKQIQYIAKHRKVVCVSKLVEMVRNGNGVKGLVSVTIDDAYEDAYTHAFPVIKKYNIPVSIFVPTGLIGRTMTTSKGITFPLLSMEHIQEMKESGLVEFLPHSSTHRELPGLSPQEVREEIVSSTRVIQNLNGVRPLVFVAPRGKHSEDVISILKDEGYVATLSVKPGLVYKKDSRFLLPRNSIHSVTTMPQFKGYLSHAIVGWCAIKRFVSRVKNMA